MTLESVVVVIEGAEAGLVEVAEDWSKLVNGIPLLVFSPPFLRLFTITLLHPCASVENGGVSLFASLAGWSVSATLR